MIQPPYLQKGSKVALVSPAKTVSRENVLPAIEILKSWGLKVVIGKYAFAEHFQFAGTDKQRTQDLQKMLDDPEIKAIFCIRGGYGTTRIIDNLDFNKFQQHPKWIIGYSDITALHLHIHNLGIQSIHATMPLLFTRDSAQSLQTLKSALGLDKTDIREYPLIAKRKGTANGQLIGGNLSLMVSCIGTASDVDTAGKILFLEDIDEYLYHIDRMMIQLKRAGKLRNLAGLIVGHFTAMKDNDKPFGKEVNEIIWDAVKEYNYPVCFGFPTGHDAENHALVCGSTIQFTVHSKQVSLLSPIIS
ncbi:S66 peptidase family protein [Xanthocytophaga flava]|uniref:S66 peptidase family protein n=1 Tax=Xanthocytophaga flava TaxID=3048013 RepID=UPI0028D0A6D4|nr:LD-carboxypeptidase [Xanthocytophaga flavus]MDJ1471629.1 LD-carboxypeptidase [Xanthocytophaga flavus]